MLLCSTRMLAAGAISGGSLASIHTSSQNDIVTSLTMSTSWLGISIVEKDSGLWFDWIDNTRVSRPTRRKPAATTLSLLLYLKLVFYSPLLVPFRRFLLFCRLISSNGSRKTTIRKQLRVLTPCSSIARVVGNGSTLPKSSRPSLCAVDLVSNLNA